MNILRIVGGSLAVLAVLSACSSSTTGSSGGTSGTSGTSGASATCSTGDGKQACGDAFCNPGQACFNAGGSSCSNGCEADANCASGDYCDLSVKNSFGYGTCRKCSGVVANDAGSTPGACGNFAGAYRFTNAPGSSSQCNELQQGLSECALTQAACAGTLSCPGSKLTASFTLDSSNKGTWQSVVQGASVSCTFSFKSSGGSNSANVQCQLMSSGGGVVCNLIGVPN